MMESEVMMKYICIREKALVEGRKKNVSYEKPLDERDKNDELNL
jgi:hypothetical protein